MTSFIYIYIYIYKVSIYVLCIKLTVAWKQ